MADRDIAHSSRSMYGSLKYSSTVAVGSSASVNGPLTSLRVTLSLSGNVTLLTLECSEQPRRSGDRPDDRAR